MATALAPQGSQQGAMIAREDSEVGKLERQLSTRASDFKMALPAGISPEKFQRTILTAAAQNPDLLKGDRGSLILAAYKAAQDGLLPDGREAALVTFNQRFKDPADGQWKSKKLIQYMPMVYGLRKKILQARDANGNPVVSALQVGVVYKAEVEQGYFLWERGSDPEVQHRPMLDISAEDASDENIVAAYSIATMSDGTRSCEVMRRFEIDRVREMSQTGALGRTDRSGKAIDAKGPWVDWFPEMAKKTVMRRHSKTLPMSGDVLLDLGGEAENISASRSALGVLGSEFPDTPQLITDESGDQIDTSTGEIIEGQASEAAAENPAKEKEEKKPARGTGKADKPAEPEQAAQPEPEQDESGQSKHPAEAKAEELLASMARAETIIDLDRIFGGAESDIMAMPDEIRSVVDAAYSRNTRRLSPARAEPEPAE
jgi:recombination protein RecT